MPILDSRVDISARAGGEGLQATATHSAQVGTMACEFYKSPKPLSWDARDYLEFPSCSAPYSIA